MKLLTKTHVQLRPSFRPRPSHLRARATSTAMAAPAAADASAMPRRSGVFTSEGDAAGGAIGSTDAGGASEYSKLLGAWWRGKRGALRGCTRGVC